MTSETKEAPRVRGWACLKFAREEAKVDARWVYGMARLESAAEEEKEDAVGDGRVLRLAVDLLRCIPDECVLRRQLLDDIIFALLPPAADGPDDGRRRAAREEDPLFLTRRLAELINAARAQHSPDPLGAVLKESAARARHSLAPTGWTGHVAIQDAADAQVACLCDNFDLSILCDLPEAVARLFQAPSPIDDP